MTNVSIKEMPYEEKYENIQDSLEMNRSFKTEFVSQHLGEEAANELNMLWEQETEPIPVGASAETRYEITYANWLSMGKVATDFVMERMGEEGLTSLENDEVELLIQQNASPSLYLLALIRAVSPGTAFKMIAGQLAYELQWITPYKVTELDKQRLIIDTPDCKVLHYPGAEEACHICQTVYPRWVAEQFKVNMAFNRRENSCKLIAKTLN